MSPRTLLANSALSLSLPVCLRGGHPRKNACVRNVSPNVGTEGMLLFSWALEASPSSPHGPGPPPHLLSIGKPLSVRPWDCSLKLPSALVDLLLFPQPEMLFPLLLTSFFKPTSSDITTSQQIPQSPHSVLNSSFSKV